MVYKKSAPFGLAGLPGAEENGNRNDFSQTFSKTQLKNGVRKGTCLQCDRLSHNADCAGFCTVLSASRSFLLSCFPVPAVDLCRVIMRRCLHEHFRLDFRASFADSELP